MNIRPFRQNGWGKGLVRRAGRGVVWSGHTWADRRGGGGGGLDPTLSKNSSPQGHGKDFLVKIPSIPQIKPLLVSYRRLVGRTQIRLKDLQEGGGAKSEWLI